MANMVIPNEGKELLVQMAFGDPSTITEDFHVHLYQNNYTPVDGSTAANFTESTFTGYNAITVLRTSFTTISLIANVAYAVSTSTPTFTCTAGAAQLAYGWYMTGATSGKVYAAAIFDTVRNMAPGASEELSPFQFACQTFH